MKWIKLLLMALVCKGWHQRAFDHDLTTQFGQRCTRCGRRWVINSQFLSDYDKWLQAKFREVGR